MEVAQSGTRPAAAWAPTVIRVILGITFMAHGSQKLFGWFGGHGIAGVEKMMGNLGASPPVFWAWIVSLVEFFGGLAVFLGLLSGVACVFIIIDMIVAIAKVHWANGFFNHRDPQNPTSNLLGYEYNLSLIAMCVSLVISGPGRVSLAGLLRLPFWAR